MKNLALAVLLTLGLATSARSTAICAVGTMKSYLSVGSCTVSGLTFSTFTYTYSGYGVPFASGVTVTPLSGGGLAGLEFSAPWSASGTHVEGSGIGFVAAPGTEWVGMSSFSQSGSGLVSVTSAKGIISLFDMTGGALGGPEYASETGPVKISVNVYGRGGTAAVGAVTAEFPNGTSNARFAASQTPEIGTMLMLGTGLALMTLSVCIKRALA